MLSGTSKKIHIRHLENGSTGIKFATFSLKYLVIDEVVNNISCGILSSDVQRVILGTQDGLVKIWNYKQGKSAGCWKTVVGHLEMVWIVLLLTWLTLR